MEEQISSKYRPLTPKELEDYLHSSPKMEKQISGKRGLFTAEELDVIICALIRYQTELRARLPIMEKYAGPEHLESHKERIAISEELLKDLS